MDLLVSSSGAFNKIYTLLVIDSAVRAHFVNEDNGSYVVHIKSFDGLRDAKFCAVGAEHVRNRETARTAEEVNGDDRHLKV